MDSEEFLRAWERFKRLDLPMMKTKGVVVEYDIAGTQYHHFDRAGIPAIYNIGREFDWSFILGLQNPNCLFSHSYSEEAYHVMQSQTYHIEQTFYTKVGLGRPLTCRFEPCFLGKSSCTTSLKCIDKTTNDILFTCERKVVFVNLKTKRPVPVPENNAAYFRGLSNPPVYVVTKLAPVNCFNVDRKVQPSDCDVLQHASNLVYLRWAIDAATEISHQSKLKSFKGDIAEYYIRKVELVHYRETTPYQLVTIRLWEDSEESNTLLFQIECNNGRKVTFLRVQFYPIGEVLNKASRM